MEAVEARRRTDLLFRRISDRRPDIEKRLNYYRGKSGVLRFASKEFSDYYAKRYEGFSDNWCAPVVGPTVERMKHQGVLLPGQTRADEQAKRAWTENDCDRGSSEAYTVFSAAALAYTLVSPKGSDDVRVTWESPLQAIVDFDPYTGERRYGLVAWVDDRHDYATLYTPDEVFKWRRANGGEEVQKKLILPEGVVGGWEAYHPASDDTWPIRNPLGQVPLVEHRNQTLLDDTPISDIDGVIAMQDAINLVWAYLFNALDYASLPQRIVTGAEMPELPVLDAQGQQVGTRVVDLNMLIQERILWIPNGNAKTSEWSSAKLDVFSAVIEHGVDHVAAQTRTPPHYLVAKMVNTNAEALTVAEAGLVSKSKERIVYVTAPHRQMYELMFTALNEPKKAREARASTLLWANPQYRSEAQLADANMKRKGYGYPTEYLFELDGHDPDEVKRIMRMREAEQRDTQLDDMLERVDVVGKQATAYGTLIRAGAKDKAAAETVGLPPIDHTGLLPVTVQSEEKAVAVPGSANGTPGDRENPPAGD